MHIETTRAERIKSLSLDLDATNKEATRLRDLRFQHRFIKTRPIRGNRYQKCPQNQEHAARRLAQLNLRTTQLHALLARA